MDTPSVDTLCRVYVKIRDKKQTIQKEADEQIEALDAQLKEVAGAIKEIMRAAGTTSMKTPHGTAYMQPKTKYYAMDWSVFGQWIIQNQAIELMEKRVAQANMAQWVKEHPSNVPPGLQADTELTVTVRKS